MSSDPKPEKPFEVLNDTPKPPKPAIFDAVSAAGDDVGRVRAMFDAGEVTSYDLADEAGMTLIMHAAWKGNYNVAKYLIDQGADVNGGAHEHDYSALHFAALAGKANLCQLLVEHGAKADHVNTVRRTPAQMAAFVGNHECVAVINNYVPKEDVYYYTRKQPLEKEPKLPVELAKPIHKLVMSMNTHPVRIALILKENVELMANIGKVCQILELMCDREFKRRDVNEVLSLKYHIIFYILKDIKKQLEKDQSSITEKKTPFIDRWIKSMLLGRESDGFPVFQEDFLRQGIKEFPFQESQLFKMLVTNFVHCKNYGEGPSAADAINSSFNGQKGFKDLENCAVCGNENAEKKCSTCKSVDYCGATCQKLHWFVHKKLCPKLKEAYEKRTPATKESSSEKAETK